jgi:hypothetical protein
MIKRLIYANFSRRDAKIIVSFHRVRLYNYCGIASRENRVNGFCGAAKKIA